MKLTFESATSSDMLFISFALKRELSGDKYSSIIHSNRASIFKTIATSPSLESSTGVCSWLQPMVMTKLVSKIF
jgi:hypothetical protein